MNFSQVQEIDLNLIRQINGMIHPFRDGNGRTGRFFDESDAFKAGKVFLA